MTARIVVVADNRSLSLGLAGQDFDVIDLRPDELTGWNDGAEAPDLVLVGVESPMNAVEIVGECRSRHATVPVLLVASDSPGWNSVRQLDDSEVEVLTLPVSRLSLVNAVHRAVGNGSAPPSPAAPEPSASEPEVAPAAEDAVAVLSSAEAVVATDDGPVARRGAQQRIVAVRSTAGLRERLAKQPAVATERGSAEVLDAPAVAVVPEAEKPPAQRTAPVHRTSPREQSAEWSLVRDAGTVEPERSPASRSATTHDLVASLLAHVDALIDVRDAANALVEEAAAAADAAYGAVLLPDDDVWRVCGATGVRPLEWRYVVEADSWLAATVIEGGRGVIVEDSDIARQRLGGAPLAHHQHLLAAPVPGAYGLLILARDTDAFDEDQLSRAATASAEAGALLAECLQVRALARALSDFRDLDR
ncbi:MAG TPA: hypothetical protein VFH66_00065 [Mycobacteriales bacterium]|nr:hypothetical protein [Mycobacteriales bacterium]